VALVSSVVMKGLVAGKRTACASNMRQIGRAIFAYCDDHDGSFPQTTHGVPISERTNAWIHSLAPYMSNVDRVRISPGDRRGEARLGNDGTSYIMNEYVAVTLRSFGGVSEDYTNIDYLVKPSLTYLMFIAADDLPPGITSDHTHSRAWPSGWDTVLEDIQPDMHRVGSARGDHTRGKSNYLFADGHVDSIEGKDMKKIWEQNRDFARPPE
ncbi:MAG: hypothetical protein AAF492_32015, partial [Verrucomicrobiota bacterium]